MSRRTLAAALIAAATLLSAPSALASPVGKPDPKPSASLTFEGEKPKSPFRGYRPNHSPEKVNPVWRSWQFTTPGDIVEYKISGIAAYDKERWLYHSEREGKKAVIITRYKDGKEVKKLAEAMTAENSPLNENFTTFYVSRGYSSAYQARLSGDKPFPCLLLENPLEGKFIYSEDVPMGGLVYQEDYERKTIRELTGFWRQFQPAPSDLSIWDRSAQEFLEEKEYRAKNSFIFERVTPQPASSPCPCVINYWIGFYRCGNVERPKTNDCPCLGCSVCPAARPGTTPIIGPMKTQEKVCAGYAAWKKSKDIEFNRHNWLREEADSTPRYFEEPIENARIGLWSNGESTKILAEKFGYISTSYHLSLRLAVYYTVKRAEEQAPEENYTLTKKVCVVEEQGSWFMVETIIDATGKVPTGVAIGVPAVSAFDPADFPLKQWPAYFTQTTSRQLGGAKVELDQYLILEGPFPKREALPGGGERQEITRRRHDLFLTRDAEPMVGKWQALERWYFQETDANGKVVDYNHRAIYTITTRDQARPMNEQESYEESPGSPAVLGRAARPDRPRPDARAGPLGCAREPSHAVTRTFSHGVREPLLVRMTP
jgi:hypothetical protein